ncbi:MAG: hypothetical protein K9K67_15785 [Bacteriovoracaceae bacterium]|nr:hypothetical protein [Bacteriovoracaceae bacterium]
MGQSKVKEFLAKKYNFILIGIINILLFHFAILRLFFFLYDSSGRQTYSSLGLTLLVDVGLILFFCAPHSFLLSSGIKTKLLKSIPGPLYATFYSLHACLGIILLDKYWGNFGVEYYRYEFSFEYSRAMLIQLPYVLSWVFMFWAMLSTGLFKQSGIEEWYKSLKGIGFKNRLVSGGAYSICRHPIYAAFLAMIWTAPNMTGDHLLLSFSWSFYIFWGAGQKERRLMRNKNYQRYATEVTAFPFVGQFVDNFISRTLWRIH